MWLAGAAVIWLGRAGLALRGALETAGKFGLWINLLDANFCWAFIEAVEPEVPWRAAAGLAACGISWTDATCRTALSAFEAEVVAWVVNISVSAVNDTLLTSQMEEVSHSTARAGLGGTLASEAGGIAELAPVGACIEVSSI